MPQGSLSPDLPDLVGLKSTFLSPGPGKDTSGMFINQTNWQALKTAKPSAEFKNGLSFK